MANETKPTNTNKKKTLHVIVESNMQSLVAEANRVGVTEREYKEIVPTSVGYVLTYFR